MRSLVCITCPIGIPPAASARLSSSSRSGPSNGAAKIKVACHSVCFAAQVWGNWRATTRATAVSTATALNSVANSSNACSSSGAVLISLISNEHTTTHACKTAGQGYQQDCQSVRSLRAGTTVGIAGHREVTLRGDLLLWDLSSFSTVCHPQDFHRFFAGIKIRNGIGIPSNSCGVGCGPPVSVRLQAKPGADSQPHRHRFAKGLNGPEAKSVETRCALSGSGDSAFEKAQ